MRAFSALLAVLLLCGLVSAQKINRGDRAKIRETRETMKSLQLDLSTVRQIQGTYPDSLKAIVDNELRENLPRDGWARDFSYETSIEHGFIIKSMGADGKSGGEGANADITWTQAGELRLMSADERAVYQARLEEQRFQASRVVARERMIIAGAEVVNFRRTEGKWPAKLADCKRKGAGRTDTAINACFVDPWGHEFTLRTLPKDNFAVICWGADGKEDGHGRDADFVITEREIREIYNVNVDDWWGWNPGGNDRDWRAQDLAQDVVRFRERSGKLPAELADLTRAGAPDEKGDVPQPIRNNVPKDRWGNDYVYVMLNEAEFYIVGLGKDEIEGGIKDNADVIYPEPGSDPATMNPGEAWGPGVVKVEPEPDTNAELVVIATEQMLDIIDKANAYHAEHEKYPASLEDIKDEFIDEVVPKDPWGAAFAYVLAKDGETVTGFTLTCLGSDSAEGGDEHAADIVFNQDGEPQGE